MPLSRNETVKSHREPPPQGWAGAAIAALRRGETATVRPRGNSMAPKVNDGDIVELAPCTGDDTRPGDIVLVRVRGRIYLHLIKARDEARLLIGNNRGGLNGWVAPGAVFGKAIRLRRK